jgi:hypothetical protein
MLGEENMPISKIKNKSSYTGKVIIKSINYANKDKL